MATSLTSSTLCVLSSIKKQPVFPCPRLSMATPLTCSTPVAAAGIWAMDSWRSKKSDLESVVFAGKSRSLERRRVSQATRGDAFLPQDEGEGGDDIGDTLGVLLQMSTIIMYGGLVELTGTGVADPLVIKVSHKMDPTELVKLIDILNPHNKPERITISIRMGAEDIKMNLPALIRAVRKAGQVVTWFSDPIRGNTMEDSSALNTHSSFDLILAEADAFFDVHEQERNHPRRMDIGMSGKNVTFYYRSSQYHTHCAPRLNVTQTIELPFIVWQRLGKRNM